MTEAITEILSRPVERLADQDFSIAKEHYIEFCNRHIDEFCVHPLGFIYAQNKINERFKLRYHIWLNTWQQPQDQMVGEIHDHNFGLTSLIVCGEIWNKMYLVNSDNAGKDSVYEVTYSEKCSLATLADEKWDKKLAAEETYNRQDIYQIAAGKFHSGGAVKKPSATLVLADYSYTTPKPRILTSAKSLPAFFDRKIIGQSIRSDLLKFLSQMSYLCPDGL